MDSPVLPTTLIEAPRLSSYLGVSLQIVSETFQRTGSFKFRAAWNVASNVPQAHLIAASSGNFGQALACACQMLGKRCTIVMPMTSSKVKIAAVQEYGGEVDLIGTATSRAERVHALAQENPDAYIASAYDDRLVIEGNASLSAELVHLSLEPDVLIAPVGGGGLTSGLLLGLRNAGKNWPVIGAEPEMANDAARSLREGRIVVNASEPQTIADGARTVSIGQKNWDLFRQDPAFRILEVPESAIVEGTRLLFSHANLKAEPTGALGIGAILAHRQEFAGKSICCVISGGNVDPQTYAQILAP